MLFRKEKIFKNLNKLFFKINLRHFQVHFFFMVFQTIINNMINIAETYVYNNLEKTFFHIQVLKHNLTPKNN